MALQRGAAACFCPCLASALEAMLRLLLLVLMLLLWTSPRHARRPRAQQSRSGWRPREEGAVAAAATSGEAGTWRCAIGSNRRRGRAHFPGGGGQP